MFVPPFLRRCLAIVLTGVMAIAITACNLENFRTSAARVPEIVDWTLSDPKTFNYALSNESPNVFTYIYEGLIAENGLTGKIEPALAKSWEISSDKKRIVFTLRDELKWSDGKPLTVDDVVFSYQDIYLNPAIATDIQDVLKIGKDRRFPSVRKLDENHVEFTTPEPFAPFLRITGIPIMPKHALEKAVKTKGSDGNPLFISTWGTDTDPRQIVCNGPYTLDSYSVNQRVIFKRNPYYWRKDDQGNPQPYIERIVWSVVENRDTALLQFRSGGLDVSEPIRPEDFTLLRQEEKRGNFTVHVGGPRPITTFMAFNLNQGRRNGKPLVDPIKSRWFNNVSFRQAVAYAIDRNKINNTIFRGLGTVIHSTIIPQSPFYLPPEKGLKVYDYSPEEARKLLLDAGFKYNAAKQLLDADGNRVQFTLMTNAGNNIREAMITQIRQDLSRIGIQVDLSPINFNVLLDKLDNSLDWDAYLMAMGGGRDPNDGANIWLPDGSSHTFNQAPQTGKKPIEGRVVADWEAEIGRLYIAGAQELDEAKRKEIYFQVQRLTQEYLPWIPMVVERIMATSRNRIEGVEYPELGGVLWNIHQLKIAA